MKRATLPPQGELRRLLHYDQETGEFTWLLGKNAGKLAGTLCSNGHGRQITINGKSFLAHRVAYMWMAGWCPDEVDHRDVNGLNNSWKNLRPANRQQNLANTRRRANINKTGFKGVSIHSETGRYMAYIKVNGKGKNLGSFLTPEEAHGAYCAAAQEAFGEYARFR